MLEVALASVLVAGDIDIRRCGAISDSVQRLTCFDELAGASQKATDTQLKEKLATQPPSNWRVDVRQSPIDDSATAVVSTQAKEPMRLKFNKEPRPMLILRCVENKTGLLIDFDGTFMADSQGYGKVTFRTDKDKPVVRSLDASTDNSTLGLWSGGSAIPAIKSLFGKSELLVRATPYSDNPQTISFDVSGVEKAIEAVRKACRW